MARIPLSTLVADRDRPEIAPDASLRDAVRLLCADWTHGALGVVENGKLTGLVSKRDILCRGIDKGMDLDSATVRDVMTPNPEALTAEETLADAYRLMHAKGYRHVPVLDADRFAGIVAYREVPVSVRNLAERFDEFSHGKPGVLEH
ncbi:MAG: hypothetical protein CSA72_04690 [Rhodobacterales bacterium]|nr:MAG: hypothetical protein CSA72_04690 [Rhodobacterales bacterium]